MIIQEKLNEIFKLSQTGDFSQAYKLVMEILAEEPQNVYALKYKEIILPHLHKKSEVGKVATVKGKNLKCPNCEAAIALSALNEEQKEKIRNHDYNNLELKCPYCHHVFTVQKRISESRIGINIGDKINYEGKNYTTVGYVLYKGFRYEGNETGNLKYLEWILIGEDNTYLYFSEGLSSLEFEFSKKVIPEFEIELKDALFYGKNLYINGWKKRINEKNVVDVISINGENSKVFTVGENIELYEFSNKGKEYVLEKETCGNQKEAGIYETKSVSIYEALEIFGMNVEEYKKNEKVNVMYAICIFIPIHLLFFSIYNGFNSDYLETFGIIILIAVILLGYFLLDKYDKIDIIKNYIIKYKKFIYCYIIGPIFGIFIIPMILSLIFDINVQIKLDEIDKSKKYRIEFTNQELKDIQTISTEEFKKGGTKTTYKEITGIKFSVLSKKDLEIIKNIQNSQENISDEIKKVFSDENKIIKVK